VLRCNQLVSNQPTGFPFLRMAMWHPTVDHIRLSDFQVPKKGLARNFPLETEKHQPGARIGRAESASVPRPLFVHPASGVACSQIPEKE
jgi:hypothetical protein